MEFLRHYKVVDVPSIPSYILVILTLLCMFSILMVILYLFYGEYIKALCSGLSLAILVTILVLFRGHCKDVYCKDMYVVQYNSTITVKELLDEWTIIEEKDGNVLVLEKKVLDTENND